ncbi:MAG: hypothetical protein IJ387_13475 [Thermoguttaceae bacterium]|nr:hypothetical protein [Thermoguttaceae bacterium]
MRLAKNPAKRVVEANLGGALLRFLTRNRLNLAERRRRTLDFGGAKLYNDGVPGTRRRRSTEMKRD